MRNVEVRLLGPLEVLVEGRPVELGAPKQRAVLAHLAVNAGEAVSLDQLIEDLWGDQAPPRATASLQAYVSNLRRVLEPDRAPRTPARILVSRAPGYALDVAHVALDVEAFDLEARTADRALRSGDPEAAAVAARNGLDRWRGEVLCDFRDEPFAQWARTRLIDARLDLSETLAQALLALGCDADVVSLVGPLTVEHPLRERLWELLIVARYRAGRPVEALRTYQEVRTLLAEELGLDPSPALRRLEQQILEQDPDLELTTQESSPTLRAERAPVWSAYQGPVDAEQAGEPRRGAAPAAAVQQQVPPELIGRDRELAQIADTLDEACAGTRSVVLVSGEAGIGKTELLESVRSLASARGMDCHFGRNHEQVAATALWPWSQIVRSILGEHPGERAVELLGDGAAPLSLLLPGQPGASFPVEDHASARLLLFEAVGRLLERTAATSPVAIVLDDLHWADGDSLRLLDFLALELRGARVAMIAGYRDDEVLPGSALADLVGSLSRHAAPHRVQLEGLDRTAMTRFASDIAGHALPETVVSALVDQTEGNPFFARELVRLLSSEGRLEPSLIEREVPSGVRDVVRRRVDRLPEDSRAVLMVAAVSGREFSVDEVGPACGLDLEHVLDALEPPLVTGLISEGGQRGERLRFSHALVAAALVDDLPAIRRRRLHARVAAAIESVHADDLEPQLARLAHHYGEAATVGAAGKAVEYARRAARQAAASGAFIEAARLWQLADDALGIDPGASELDKVDVGIELAEALSRVASAATRDQVPVVIDRALKIGDVDRAVLGAMALTRHRRTWGWSEFRGRHPDVVARLDALLERLGPKDSGDRAKVLCIRASGSYYEDPHRAHEFSSEGVAMARRLGDEDLLAQCLALHLMDLERVHQLAEFHRATEELLDLGRRTGRAEWEAMGHTSRLAARFRAGDVDGADEDHEAAVRILELTPVPALEQQLSLYPPLRHVLRGEFVQAELAASAAFELGRFRSMWAVEPTYLTQLVEIRRAQGRLFELIDSIQALPAGPSIGALNVVAAAELQRGEVTRARQIVEANGGVAAIRDDWRAVGEAVWATDVAVGLDDVDAAGWLYELLLPASGELAVTGTTVSCSGPVDLHLGRLAILLDDPPLARQHLEQALDLSCVIGAEPSQAQALAGLATLTSGRESASYRDASLAITERLGIAHPDAAPR